MPILNQDNETRIPPIYAIDVCSTRAVTVIERYPDVREIVAFGRTLPQKVASFQQALREVKDLEWNLKALVVRSAAETLELKRVIRGWLACLQLDIEGLDPADILITETKVADVWLANARRVIEMLQDRGAEVPDAEEARSALAAKAESTEATFEATQAARAAVQNKQRELRALAADVHQHMVKLRKTVRLVLGSSHPDYKLLSVPSSRAALQAEQPSGEPQADATSTVPSEGPSSPTGAG